MKQVQLYSFILLSSVMMLLLSACGADEPDATTLATAATSSHTGASPAVHMELKKKNSSGEAVGRPVCEVYSTPANTKPVVTGCPDGEYKEQLFDKNWNLIDERDVVVGSSTNPDPGTSSHTGAKPAVHMELKNADGEVICKVYDTPATTKPVIDNCPNGNYKEQLFDESWNLIDQRDVVVGSSAGPDTPGSWQTVSESPFGWLTFPGNKLGSRPNEGKGDTRDRFSLAEAPDGSRAVQHTVKKEDIVHPLGADTPILLSEPYKAARLSYKIWIEAGKGRGQPGKYMSLMGGRGQAGGSYENGPQTDKGKKSGNAEGWSYYLLSPVTSGTKGKKGAKNGHDGAIGAANRSELDPELDCRGESLPGGDPINGDNQKCFEYKHAKSGTTPTGRWVEVVMTVGMNTKGKKDGFAKYSVDGETIGEQKGVMWALDPDKTLDLWVRWRMMYGGTPEKLDPPQDVKEWYKDFALEVIY